MTAYVVAKRGVGACLTCYRTDCRGCPTATRSRLGPLSCAVCHVDLLGEEARVVGLSIRCARCAVPVPTSAADGVPPSSAAVVDAGIGSRAATSEGGSGQTAAGIPTH